MRKALLFFLIFLFLFSEIPLRAQKMIRNSSVTGVCYAGTKVTRIYIPPPAKFLRRGLSRSKGTITVNYTGFTAQARTALDYAVQILENILPADTKITLNAIYEKISAAGVLAQSTITGYVGGFGIDALNPLSLYPVALGEKIGEQSFNADTDPDITLSVNSSINWYMGTDGQTPSTSYDLVTVALHEICHGLGFFDSFSVTGNTGSYGIGSLPLIYDTFLENFSGLKLTDTLHFLNNSTDLKTVLTGTQVYFNGPLLKKYTTQPSYSTQRAKIYAPPTFDAGSSISHLDENAAKQVDALMTPFIDKGEAIHNPGQFTVSILGDLGWINTKIVHKPSHDTESHINSIPLSLTIKSDTAYNHNKVEIVYSYNNFQLSDTLPLTPAGNDVYNISLTVPSYNSELQYYFYTEDTFLRIFRSPSLYKDYSFIKNNRYKVFIGTDTIKPVITHTPVTFYLQTVDSIKFEANVRDNLGLDSTYVEFKINNGPSRFIRLSEGANDKFSAALGAKSLILKGHDSIQYKIFAVDTAHVPNLAVRPKTGFFVTHIEEISSPVTQYATDFSAAAPDFFNVGFDISKPAGFSKYGLNSKHPYESPEDNSKTLNFTSILRHPIIINQSGLTFTYNEIVLVEPGAQGSVFGSPDFYDYVIVEGSKDFGKTWFNLIDGNDCRFISVWETSYNSSISGDNSTFVPTESLLRRHSFLFRPSDKISAGDSMLVRFRLFSDPFANGWGWVVEDLNIRPLIDSVHELPANQVSIYPNPGNGLIWINFGNHIQSAGQPIRYRVFNSGGVIIAGGTLSGTDSAIDISKYSRGFYIVVLYLDDGIKTIKYDLIK